MVGKRGWRWQGLVVAACIFKQDKDIPHMTQPTTKHEAWRFWEVLKASGKVGEDSKMELAVWALLRAPFLM